MHLACFSGQTLQTRDPPARSQSDEDPLTDVQVRQLWNRLSAPTHTRRIRCGVITSRNCERTGDIRHPAFVPSGLVGGGPELLCLSSDVSQEASQTFITQFKPLLHPSHQRHHRHSGFKSGCPHILNEIFNWCMYACIVIIDLADVAKRIGVRLRSCLCRRHRLMAAWRLPCL
jgi:hypothetical protein